MQSIWIVSKIVEAGPIKLLRSLEYIIQAAIWLEKCAEVWY